MIRTLCLTFLSLLFTVQALYSQTQYENAGFEEWEDIPYGSIPEPVDWSSIRTADPDELAQIAPAVWDRSDDAHTGNYSVYLTNLGIFGIVATGTLTNGKILANLDPTMGNSHTVEGDPRWNTPLTGRPDSLVGWYKSKPTAGDFPTVHAVLHTGYASIPQEDSSSWVGEAFAELSTSEVNTWTRFSVPFHYYRDDNPEYILSILTAGNGTDALEGSEFWCDDLELIYNSSSISEYNSDRLKVYYARGTMKIFVDAARNIPVELDIHDLAGRSVYHSRITAGQQNSLQPDLREGVYVVTVKIEDRLLSQKLLVR